MTKKYKPINIVLLVYLGLYLPVILIVIAALLLGGTFNLQEFIDGIIYLNIPYILPDGWLNNVYTKIAFGIIQACIIFSYLILTINPGTENRWAYIGVPAIIIYCLLYVFVILYSVLFSFARWG